MSMMVEARSTWGAVAIWTTGIVSSVLAVTAAIAAGVFAGLATCNALALSIPFVAAVILGVLVGIVAMKLAAAVSGLLAYGATALCALFVAKAMS